MNIKKLSTRLAIMSLTSATPRTWNHRPMLLSLSSVCLISLLSGCSTTQSNSEEPPPPPPPETSVVQEHGISPAPVTATEDATNTVPDEAQADEQPLRYEATGIAFLEPAEKIIKNQSVKSTDFVEASGYGFPSPLATTPSQKMLTATEAAQYRAMANLAEKQLGLDVKREATTSDMAFSSEDVTISLSGTLKGVSEVSRSYDAAAEIATVTLKMNLAPEKVPEKKSPPLTLEQRKSRAEMAARIHATALLREQIGGTYVEQEIQVNGLDLTLQMASIHVEGLLKNVQFSDTRWTSESICEVTASLEIKTEDEVEKDVTAE
jgi:hypothetical protein